MAPTINLPSFRHLDPDNPENQFSTLTSSRYQTAVRTLPAPLPPQNLTHAFPHPDTFTNRALTHAPSSRLAESSGLGGTTYASAVDATMMMASRHMHTNKSKDVKRRTKTGCMTCRKRRIKVRLVLLLLSFPSFSKYTSRTAVGMPSGREVCTI